MRRLLRYRPSFGALLAAAAMVMLCYIVYVVYNIQKPIVTVSAARVVHPRPVCPGDVIVIEYDSTVLKPGTQVLAAGSTWYHPASKTRYVVASSIDGAVFAANAPVDHTHIETRVPSTLPPGLNEYWRGILGQSNTLVRLGIEILPAAQCPQTEIEDQEVR